MVKAITGFKLGSQSVVLDSIFSGPVQVLSGVPQGTVLGPLMFLLYINDITQGINSPLRLFADDCLLYRIISSIEDTVRLQEDLNRLSEWTDTWQFRFNITKCSVIRCTRSMTSFINNYSHNDHLLNLSDQHTYLGVSIHKHLSWTPHITGVVAKLWTFWNVTLQGKLKNSLTLQWSGHN